MLIFKHPKTPKPVSFSTYPKSPNVIAPSSKSWMHRTVTLPSTEKLLPSTLGHCHKAEKLLPSTWKAEKLNPSLICVNRQVDQRLHLAWPKRQYRWQYHLCRQWQWRHYHVSQPQTTCQWWRAPLWIFSCRIRSKEHPCGNSFKTIPNGEIVCKRTPFGAIYLIMHFFLYRKNQ